MLVVKIGGSLIGHAREIIEILKSYRVLIVPGGGAFADTVRKVYMQYKLSEHAAHEMAIMGMNQYGLLLSDVSGIETIEALKDVGHARIFLPYKFITSRDPFEPSWDITSDTIACYIAGQIKAERFIILTDVGGIFIENKIVDKISARELLKYGKTCVDKGLPKFLLNYKMDCWVVDGRDLNRVEKAMNGDLRGTLIVGKV
jgi:hypothetical protein